MTHRKMTPGTKTAYPAPDNRKPQDDAQAIAEQEEDTMSDAGAFEEMETGRLARLGLAPGPSYFEGSPDDLVELDQSCSPRHPEITVRMTQEDAGSFMAFTKVTLAMREAGIPEEEVREFLDEAVRSRTDEEMNGAALRWVSVEVDPPEDYTSVIRLEVPSGTVIITDDLRPLYDWDDEGLASYNTALGQHQVIGVMAAQGCAYGPVGNSCPGFYRTGPDTYVIASPEYDEDADKELIPASWEHLAAVITDLWAYSVADHADWLARGGDPEGLDWADTIVDLPAGTYEFTHHTGEAGFDGYAAGTVIFAHVRKLP